MSQSEGESFLASLGGTAALGILLALIGAALAGISPATSLIFGDHLHRIYQDGIKRV